MNKDSYNILNVQNILLYPENKRLEIFHEILLEEPNILKESISNKYKNYLEKFMNQLKNKSVKILILTNDCFAKRKKVQNTEYPNQYESQGR